MVPLAWLGSTWSLTKSSLAPTSQGKLGLAGAGYRDGLADLKPGFPTGGAWPAGVSSERPSPARPQPSTSRQACLARNIRLDSSTATGLVQE